MNKQTNKANNNNNIQLTVHTVNQTSYRISIKSLKGSVNINNQYTHNVLDSMYIYCHKYVIVVEHTELRHTSET